MTTPAVAGAEPAGAELAGAEPVGSGQPVTTRWTGAAWDGNEPLECTAVIPEAPGVCSFVFRSPSGAWFRYRPGQFVTLDLPLASGTVRRSYTLSSSPSRPLAVSITVKAQTGSLASRWMLDHLVPGVHLHASAPAGQFALPDRPQGRYLFISAGSGITPMMAMTTYLFDQGETPDIAFVGCARRPSDLIFRRRLEHMAGRMPGLRLNWVVAQDDPFDAWTGYRGRFNQLMLGLMAPDTLGREVFCCGPESFMASVRDMLHAFGFDMAHYHQESYHPTAAAVPAGQDDVVPDAAAMARVVFTLAGVTAQCHETDTLLAVSKAAGLNIPSGCTFGVCGTCRTKKLSGDVVMVHNGGISDEDIAAGYVLACCSRPIGTVEIAV